MIGARSRAGARLKRLILIAGLLCPAASVPAAAQSSCYPLDPTLCKMRDMSRVPPGADPANLKYGRKHWQQIDFYRAHGDGPVPLVVVIGTGGTSGWTGWLRYRLNEAGYSVAFVRYSENVPTADAALTAYASAIAYLLQDAAELGLDSSRVGLFGPGFGAEAAALLATDPSILAQVGVPFEAVRGVVTYNGGNLDATRSLADTPHLAARFRRYYGRDPASLARHSPVTHLAPPNAPAFLMMADEEDVETTIESRHAADAFVQAGLDTRFVVLPAERPGARETLFMLDPDGAGREVLPFLDAALNRTPG